ncbi:MAG: DUF362 domain-containing protein [Proteobacteria bacterium]|nr:DUF362 domain-containing protein [Pseudomonadota bacterium]
MGSQNHNSRRLIDRREALKLGAAASAAGILGLNPLNSHAVDMQSGVPVLVSGPGHVVKVHMPGMRGRLFPHAEAAKAMVDKAVTTLAKETDLGRAWSKFIQKEDKVGIKINCLGGRFSSTMKEVVDAVVEGVRAVGVLDENIMIFDQFGGNMRGARYLWQDKPGRLRVINHDVLGYEKDWIRVEGCRGKLSKALTWSTAIINVPVIKDHDLAGAGITCAVKNMVCGCVERPGLMHREIQTALPHFYAREEIRSRVRLTIADGSFCLYDGGPKHNPAAHITHDCIYASTDPVAMDAIALEVVEGLRKEKRLRSLDAVRRPATYLKLAEEIGLGIADREKIFLETLELPSFPGASA